MKKKIKQQEIKKYGEEVSKLYLPKINISMKKEREERIKNLDTKNNIPHLTKKKKRNIMKKKKMKKNQKILQKGKKLMRQRKIQWKK